MNILVVGSGGREHALVKALRVADEGRQKGGALQTPRIFIWPGNDGIALEAERVDIEKGNYTALAQWASENNIDLAVIGPEVELVDGIADVLRAKNIAVFGPSKAAAQLEGSKIFAKEFMREYHVPTARAQIVERVDETLKAAQKYAPPYVLKADGLAAGKGVYICADLNQLESAARELFVEKKLGAAGARALLEEFQPGKELSVLVLTNGKDYQVLPFARDHKRLRDGDHGPNTGGMGVVAPVSIDKNLIEQIESEIIKPTLVGLQKRDFLFRGVVFIGLMLTPSGPQVLEYNVRFGDPETQTILPLLAQGSTSDSRDWQSVLLAIANGRVPQLSWSQAAVACVVLAAEGYPDNPVKGVEIQLPVAASNVDDSTSSYILHAGTQRKGDKFYTNGGRVLNVIARGQDLSEALQKAYALVGQVRWPGMQYRKDIGK